MGWKRRSGLIGSRVGQVRGGGLVVVKGLESSGVWWVSG